MEDQSNMDPEYYYTPPYSDALHFEEEEEEDQQEEQNNSNNNTLKKTKRKRQRQGRTPGSGKLQQIASAETEGRFTPYVITVNTGEDVVEKILTVFRNSPQAQAVCIFSATGSASKLIINNPDPTKLTLTFKGLFEIISLSGSYLYVLSHGGVRRKKELSLSASLQHTDGTAFGGSVKSLIAGLPIDLVVATFKQYTSKQIKRNSARSSAAAAANMSSDDDSDLKWLHEYDPGLIEGESGYVSPTSGLIIQKNNELPENNTIAVTTTTGI